MTYVRLPSPVRLNAAVEQRVNGQKQCGRCKRWLPLYEFESKGIRAGRQIRRGTCITCRGDRKTPLIRVDEWERTCLACGKRKRLMAFYHCGKPGQPYWRWTCRACVCKQQRPVNRTRYAKGRLSAGLTYTPCPEWRYPYWHQKRT